MNKNMTIKIDPFSLPIPQLHKLLLGSIAPRPIAFASTIDSDGNPNLSPFSFFNAFGVNPTTLIFSPSRRGRDNTTKHTYENIKEVPEVVINVVNFDMVHQASLASTEYPKGVNEFIKAGFTPLPSETIKPFRVKESPVQFECKVRQVIETGSGGGAANLVICEVNMIHVHEDILDENGVPDPNKIKLVGRHTGDFYVKAFGESLFEVEKPLARLGIGIDILPDKIKCSKILSGNDLGQLGNMEALPSEIEINSIQENPVVKNILDDLKNKPMKLELEFQLLAKKWIDDGRVADAFALLMV
jgi:flavin reductase (DIM6/NTAB) family NADH-FMN oxidoreductase RutF